jgi:CDP-diacylglycerol--serine O-phosphatidyltransferase
MRKIYIVPNLVTTANMFAGFYAVIASIEGDFTKACYGIMAAIIFDSLDGRIARLARATSQFGVEYDSLSDLISFGLAPAVLMFQWTLRRLSQRFIFFNRAPAGLPMKSMRWC